MAPITKTSPRSRWFAVYVNDQCVGFVISRDRGKTFQAYDADTRLIGSFDSKGGGVDALVKAAQP